MWQCTFLEKQCPKFKLQHPDLRKGMKEGMEGKEEGGKT